MKVIGITGPTGAGKTTVSRILKQYGAEHLDCDLIAKEAVEGSKECLKRLADEFGGDVVKDGRLDRALLAMRAFSSRANTEKLNQITHAYIVAEIERRIEDIRKRGAKAVTVDAAALKESGFSRRCDAKICVLAAENERLLRLAERDALPQERLKQRIDAQLGEIIYAQDADIVIINNGSFDELEAKVRAAAEALGLCDESFEEKKDS